MIMLSDKNYKVKSKELISGLYLFILLAAISTASAGNITVDQLLETYSYEFNSGFLRIHFYNDSMVDNNANGQNDTLILSLTFNTTNASNYNVIADLMEGSELISNETNKTLSTGISNFNISFSSGLLSQVSFNYTVRVYNNESLVYRKDKMLTRNYTSYERGINITSISDQSINNDYLQINLTLNISNNGVYNITGYLKYNESYISAKDQFSLTTGLQTIELKFSNETIKKTHYAGNYTLDYVEIGPRIFNTNHSTLSYNYEDFAKTSYFKNYSAVQVDVNANNLSEYLRFNATLVIKTSGSYILDAKLYDSFGKFIVNVSGVQSLSAGTKNFVIDINGTLIYASKLDGPYIFEYVKLYNASETIDIAYQPYTTNTSYYSDFERPPQPDLTIVLNTTFSSSNQTNITINITNQGAAPAFNIIIDVFDNNTYENQTSTSYLNISESQIFNFLASNTTNNSLFLAIVDFNNLVDESNESNNIADNDVVRVSLNILSLSQIYSLESYKIFEFIIENNGETQLNNVTWSLNLGDGTILNSSYNSNLSSDETIYTYVEYNYSVDGNFTVTANATAISDGISALQTLEIRVGELLIDSLLELSRFGKIILYEIVILNIKNESINNINWSVNISGANIYSNQKVNLTSNETIYLFFEQNYTNFGEYQVRATTFNQNFTNTKTLTTILKELIVSGLKVLNATATLRQFEFLINNTLNFSVNNINWTLNTGLSNISSSLVINLTINETVYVITDYNYTVNATYLVNATARKNESSQDSQVINVTI